MVTKAGWGFVLVACAADPSGSGDTETDVGTGPSSSVSGSGSGVTSDANPTTPTTASSTDSPPTSSSTASSTDDPSGTESSESTETGDPPPPTSTRCGDPRLARAMPSFAAPIQLQADLGTGGSAAGDLDGDGRDEFVAQIQFRIYDFDGADWTSFQPLANLNGRGNRFAGDIEVADMDGDDDIDIVVPDSDNAGTQGSVSWFENPGALEGKWIEHEITTFTGSGDPDTVEHLSELELADMDGDGSIEVVVRDISHGVWVMTESGDAWDRAYIPVLPREGLELWDPDENGRLDILLNGIWLETPADLVDGVYTEHPIIGMEDWYAPDLSTPSIRDYASKVEAADFDGDGNVDVAINNAEELASGSPNKQRGIAVYLQPADLINDAWTEVILTNEHWAWHTLELSDFDFDGSMDVMSAISAVGTDNAADEIGLWLNDGTGTAFAGQTIDTSATVYQGVIGDADGDGDCDFLAPDHFNSGPIRYFENTTAP